MKAKNVREFIEVFDKKWEELKADLLQVADKNNGEVDVPVGPATQMISLDKLFDNLWAGIEGFFDQFSNEGKPNGNVTFDGDGNVVYMDDDAHPVENDGPEIDPQPTPEPAPAPVVEPAPAPADADPTYDPSVDDAKPDANTAKTP